MQDRGISEFRNYSVGTHTPGLPSNPLKLSLFWRKSEQFDRLGVWIWVHTVSRERKAVPKKDKFINLRAVGGQMEIAMDWRDCKVDKES